MANQLLTTDLITDRALMIFSQASTVLKSLPRTYEKDFKGTPKVGDHVRVPVPQHGVVREGRVANPQPLKTLVRPVTIQSQRGIDLTFSSSELALDIEEFSRRYLDQQIADLVVSIEADVQQLMYQWIPNQAGNPAAQWTNIGEANKAKKYIEDNGGGSGTKRMVTNNATDVTLINGMRGLFNSQKQIDVQYEDGYIGRASGFDWASSTVTPIHTNGTAATTAYRVNGANQTGSVITIGTGTGTITKGSIVTFAGCNAVHMQTKQNLGYLRQFVVTEDYAGGGGNLSIYPAIVTSGSEQNVSASPTTGTNGTVTISGAADASYGINLAYRPEAFQFVTVDLPELSGWDTSRRSYDGISMRYTRGSDMVNDQNLHRLDVMWGFGAMRPEWASRVANDVSNLTLA